MSSLFVCYNIRVDWKGQKIEFLVFVSHYTINFVVDNTQISGISKEPVNILFNPSTIAKKMFGR